MLGGDLCDLLILVFKMASVSGLILWKVDPDLAGVDIRECCVNIRKSTSLSGEGHVDEEKTINNSIVESVNLTLEGIGRLSLIDPVPKRDEHVSVNNYQFSTRRTDMADKIEEFSHIRECSVKIGKCTSVYGVGYVGEEESINNEDSDRTDYIFEPNKSKLAKAAPKTTVLKK